MGIIHAVLQRTCNVSTLLPRNDVIILCDVMCLLNPQPNTIVIHSGQHLWFPASLTKLAESSFAGERRGVRDRNPLRKVQTALAAKLETKYVGLIESCTHLKFSITHFVDGPVERLRNKCNKL